MLSLGTPTVIPYRQVCALISRGGYGTGASCAFTYIRATERKRINKEQPPPCLKVHFFLYILLTRAFHTPVPRKQVRAHQPCGQQGQSGPGRDKQAGPGMHFYHPRDEQRASWVVIHPQKRGYLEEVQKPRMKGL